MYTPILTEDVVGGTFSFISRKILQLKTVWLYTKQKPLVSDTGKTTKKNTTGTFQTGSHGKRLNMNITKLLLWIIPIFTLLLSEEVSEIPLKIHEFSIS
jgi:hypothetical protein